MLEVVGLKGYERQDTSNLSGGQQQRVAIARGPDQPPQGPFAGRALGALDLKLRKEMQLELKRLQQAMDITFYLCDPRPGRGAHHVRHGGGHARRRHPADRQPH